MIDVLITLLVFLFIFGSLIILHEFGHYFAAKLAKIKVLEFGLGLPPKIFSKKIKGTEWTINALPFGGFVRLLGEEGGSKDPYAFANRPWGWKVLVVLGGVIVNFFIGWLLLFGLFFYGSTPSYSTLQEYEALKQDGYFLEKKDAIFFSGNPEALKKFHLQTGDIITNASSLAEAQLLLKTEGNTLLIDRWNDEEKKFTHLTVNVQAPIDVQMPKIVVESTLPNSVAEQIGLQKNDQILKINDKEIYTLFDIAKALQALSVGERASVTVLRYNTDVLELSFSVPENKRLGVYSLPLSTEAIVLSRADIPFVLKKKSFGFIESIQKSFFASFSIVENSAQMVQKMMHQVAENFSIPQEIGGPIAIAHTTGQILEFGNVENLFFFAAMISLSLAFMNILPIPGLDGGRLLFLLFDAVFIVKKKIFTFLKMKNYGGEKIPETIEAYFHVVGYFFLIGLLLIISWNDIVRVFLR